MDSASISNEDQAEATIEKRPPSNLRTGYATEYFGINERVESGRDWLFLANEHKSLTWGIMLKTREKLQEYGHAPQKCFQYLFAKIFPDDMLLRYKVLKSQHSPNSCDLDFLRRWFRDKNLGDFPLMGKDSTIWETSDSSSLIAIRARRAEDPLGMLFLSKIFLWWHDCIGHRIKKPVDEETRYFEYDDEHVLGFANVLGSIISSELLVRSIMALYFVDNMLVRLGIVAAFTQVFSLVLILATNARKIEVFAATAA